MSSVKRGTDKKKKENYKTIFEQNNGSGTLNSRMPQSLEKKGNLAREQDEYWRMRPWLGEDGLGQRLSDISMHSSTGTTGKDMGNYTRPTGDLGPESAHSEQVPRCC